MNLIVSRRPFSTAMMSMVLPERLRVSKDSAWLCAHKASTVLVLHFSTAHMDAVEPVEEGLRDAAR
jgi:hypothetical protein